MTRPHPHTTDAVPKIAWAWAAIPISIGALLWLSAGVLATLGQGAAALLLAYAGLFVSAGVGLFLGLPGAKKQNARRLMLPMLGGLLLFIALFSDHGNMQIEGLFFGVLAGAPYIVLHYALAKLIGPFFFGRIWCGWACWYAMLFDWLPFKHSRYRLPGKVNRLRYLHFGFSLLSALLLWFVFGYRGGATGAEGMLWFVYGLVVYYLAGVALAFFLRDNRAFCKYLCPISVPMKFGARYALLKVDGIASRCDSCNVCVEQCPMNIRIPDYILKGQRVLSTECTLCQTCIHVCPHDALTLSFKLDAGGTERLDYVPPRQQHGNLVPQDPA